MAQGKKYSEFRLILAGAAITAMVILVTSLAVLCKKLENEPTEENCEIEHDESWDGNYGSQFAYDDKVRRFTIRPEQWKK